MAACEYVVGAARDGVRVMDYFADRMTRAQPLR